MNLAVKRLILATVFLLPFVIIQKSFYPMVYSKSLFVELVTLIISTLWVIGKIYRKERLSLHRNVIFIIFGLYALLLLISGLNGVNPLLSFWGSMDQGTGVVFILHLFILSYIVSDIFRKIEDWYLLLCVFVSSGIIFTLAGFLSEMGVKFSSILTINMHSGFLIGNSSWTGIFIAFIFFISLGLAFSGKTKFQRTIGIVGSITSFFDPTLTGFIIHAEEVPRGFIGLAKTGSYSLIVGISFLILYLIFRKIESLKIRKIFIGSVASLLAIGVISVAIMGINPIRSLVAEKAGPNRLVFWDIAVEGFKEKPIIGWGGDSYQYVYAKKFDPIITTPGYAPEFWVDRAHNIYFDELVSGGIIGFVLLISLYGFILWGLIAVAIKNRGKEGILFASIFAGVVSFLIQGLMIFGNIVSWFVMGLIIAFISNFYFKNNSVDTLNIEKPKKIKKTEDNTKNNFISLVIVVIFCALFTFVILKPFRIAQGLAKFPVLPYNERLDFFKKLDNAYVGSSVDFGNAFSKYHLKLRKIIIAGLDTEKKKMMEKEINELNVVLGNGIKRQKYMDVKSMMSIVGFYSIQIAITDEKSKNDYYDKGMFYVNKMNEVSKVNPLNNSVKTLLDSALQYDEAGLDIFSTDNK